MSRETRRLLLAGTLAVAALWVLARIRFEDRPVTPNPVPAVLSQLAAPPSYDDLAASLAQLQARVEPVIAIVEAAAPDAATSERRAALRWRDDLAVVVLAGGDGDVRDVTGASVVAHDAINGLAVVRLASVDGVIAPPTWQPRRERQPRYLFASEVDAAGATVRPAYVGALEPVASPGWLEPVWAVPAGSALVAGALVFSSNAEFAGVVVTHGAGVAIVPADALLAAASRLLETPSRARSTLGVEVQPLTAPVAALTGATQGVVVTWVPPGSDAAALRVGDVIDAVNGQPILSPPHWDARTSALVAGEPATLRVRRGGDFVSVTIAAAARPPASRALGLGLRSVPGAGVEVTRVDRGSAGARAGLQRGDLVTRVGTAAAATPAQLTAVFAGLAEGARVMVAVTRGDAHHVLVLTR